MQQVFFVILFLFLAACSSIEPKPLEPSAAHIQTDEPPARKIPPPVSALPILPQPSPPQELETYTVVVNEVPVKELLFALARDARINVDIAADISGNVILNAIDQTLPQILSRLSRQVDLRYTLEGNNLIITPDRPYIHTYTIDYVNISRTTTGSNAVATQIASTSSGAPEQSQSGGGGNNSTTDVSSISAHHFWPMLVANISAILGEKLETGGISAIPVSASVIPHPESGLLSVRATARQHAGIQKFIDRLLANAKRQVLIQVTIAEVTLSDQYQTGIDWSIIENDFGVTISSLGGLPSLSNNVARAFALTYGPQPDAEGNPPEVTGDSITATVNLLDQFGDTNVLSSPQIMVLNNQTALLKVVDNIVYFEIDAEVAPGTQGGGPVSAIDTTARTVPVGIVMAVTPQISANDEILLNVRPSISSVLSFVDDPNPATVRDNDTRDTRLLVNRVPQIQVREMESVLRLINGQIGVLGGLMQNEERDVKRGLPGLVDIPFLGNFFSATNKDYSKTELVIFLRPLIINTPSIEDDLRQYKPFLTPARFQKTGIPPN